MTGTQRIPASEHFRYRNGVLHAEAVSLEEVADAVGTPTYVYSGAAVDQAFRAIDESLAGRDHMVAYAMKANGNLALLSRLASAGCGVDIVSGGELKKALEAGFPAERIVFSGVGKTDVEIEAALAAGIRSLHAESEQEIDVIESIAREAGTRAPICLRVNPDVDAETHPYIATGLSSSKFGIDLETARRLLPRLLASDHLSLEGLACHIGSMVLSPEPIGEAVAIVARFATECVEAGAKLRTLDAGGGWPILYGDESRGAESYAQFGKAVSQGVDKGGAGDLGLTLLVEPGRAIVGDAGVLLTRVLYIKRQGDKRFVVVDAAMTELIRPALYSAYHAVVSVTDRGSDTQTPADVVGPVCESGDFLARDRPLPELSRGDLLAIRGAGAYASVMASTYNGRPLAAEVLVDEAQHRIIRERQSLDDMWATERR